MEGKKIPAFLCKVFTLATIISYAGELQLEVYTSTCGGYSGKPALYVSAAPAAVIPGFQECVLNNHHYALGEEFHPVISVNGTEREAVCFDCVCQQVSRCMQ